jgi:hypothetical protein
MGYSFKLIIGKEGGAHPFTQLCTAQTEFGFLPVGGVIASAPTIPVSETVYTLLMSKPNQFPFY